MPKIGIYSTEVAVPTSGATFDVTISGIGTPKAIMCKWVGATTTETQAAHLRWSIGFADGTTQRACQAFAEDAVLAANADAGFLYSSAAVALLSGTTTEAVDGQLSWNSWITDGVRLNIDNAVASGFLLQVVFFNGDDLSAQVLEYTASATQDGTVSPTTSFQPSFILGGSAYETTASGAHARMALGICCWNPSGTIQQVCYSFYAFDRSGCHGGGVLRSNRFFAHATVGSTGTLTLGATHEVTARSSTSFTVTTRDAAVGHPQFCLVLGLGSHNCWVGVPALDLLDTDTTGDKYIEAPGFLAKYLFAISTPSATIDSGIASAAAGSGRWTHGFSDGTVNHRTGAQQEDAATTSDTRSISGNAACIGPMTDAGANHYLGTVASFLPSGFRINLSAAGASDYYTLFGAIGEAPQKGYTAPVISATKRQRTRLTRM